MRFRDRRDAGTQLGRLLAPYAGPLTVVYALPRGGVVLGAVVAEMLGAPLDVVIARKVGHPMNPEYALCAVTEHGQPVCNPHEVEAVDPAWLETATTREREEAARRRARYLGTRPSISAEGKVAILVDDGIATGLTMRAAIRDIWRQHPSKVVVAVPVIPAETAVVLREEADEVVAVEVVTDFFGAVGMYYDDFRQVEDDEVICLLRCGDDDLLFATPEYVPLAQTLGAALDWPQADWHVRPFPNGEVGIALETYVKEQPCVVMASLRPPEAGLVHPLLLCDTLRRGGASRVTLLAPYLAYTRQDRIEPGHSRATAWLGKLLAASGVKRVVTVDVHSAHAETLLPLPLLSLSPAELFAAEIHRLGWGDATLVAPDEGAQARCAAVQRAAGGKQPMVTVRKIRTPEGIAVEELATRPGPRAVIVDDILDTGGTLLACCSALRRVGVVEMLVLVTHGLFTGDVWRGLWTCGVTRIICTDTVPDMPDDPRIEVLPVAPLLARALVAEKEGV
jgi:ribose-phosphate pyrophosphokinase